MTPQQREHHKRVLDEFIGIYCRYHCQTPPGELCVDCVDLQAYAGERIDRCPMDPKPMCKDCPVHCFKGAYRDMIREVMRFSALHLLKRGRIDRLARHVLEGRRLKRQSKARARKAGAGSNNVSQ